MIYSDGATLQVEFVNSMLSQRSAMQLTEPLLYTSMYALQRRYLQIIQTPSLKASNSHVLYKRFLSRSKAHRQAIGPVPALVNDHLESPGLQPFAHSG